MLIAARLFHGMRTQLPGSDDIPTLEERMVAIREQAEIFRELSAGIAEQAYEVRTRALDTIERSRARLRVAQQNLGSADSREDRPRPDAHRI